MPDEYKYIENDNAYFRMRLGTGLCCVDEVWTPDGWKPYAGDRGKPYLEGMQVAEADVPPFPKDLRAADLLAAALRAIGGRKRPRMIDMTHKWAGKAFQILAAPGNKMTQEFIKPSTHGLPIVCGKPYDEAAYEEDLALATTERSLKKSLANRPRLILLIRHAEKPADPTNPHLSPQGQAHARRLAVTIPEKYGVPDIVFAAASDGQSARSVETAQPIVDKYKIPLVPMEATNIHALTDALENLPGKRFALVIWKHEQLPAIAGMLGTSAPFRTWPQDDYSTQLPVRK